MDTLNNLLFKNNYDLDWIFPTVTYNSVFRQNSSLHSQSYPHLVHIRLHIWCFLVYSMPPLFVSEFEWSIYRKFYKNEHKRQEYEQRHEQIS